AHQSRLEDLGEQATRPRIPPDAGRTQTPHGRTVAMGADVCRNRRAVRSTWCRGGLIMFWRSRESRTRDLNAEMQAHLDMNSRDRIAQGETPEDAARHAARAFGDRTTVRETTSDMWTSDWPHQVAQEFRHATRSLSRVPVFSLAAILTLALGIGANTA